MALNKKRILPDEYVFKQGDKGSTAFLIISGALNVEIDGKKVGKMESGEIFGELSLILGEERKASIKAIVPTEIIEIKKCPGSNSFIKQHRTSQNNSTNVKRIRKK